MYTLPGPEGVLKLVDFGFAKMGDFVSAKYTPYYAPPEVLQASAGNLV